MYTTPSVSAYLFENIFLKTFTVLVILSCVLSQQLFGQVADDFSDGDFTSNPFWSSNEVKFSVAAGTLRSVSSPNGEAYLSTLSASINDASWEFYIRMDFDPSASNYTRVYVVSSEADLSGTLNGYYVGVANESDSINLYRQDSNGNTHVIVEGKVAKLNLTSNSVKIKVTRDALGNWELLSDVFPFEGYSSEGTTFDNTHILSRFFGVRCIYTSTRSDDFYFDDFVVSGDPFVDTIAPVPETVNVLSGAALEVIFSEPVQQVHAENIANYEVPGTGNPVSAVLTDGRTVALTFSESFPNGIESTLNVTAVADTAGNVIDFASKIFLFFQPSPVSYRDLIITEIFPDPSPIVGLPGAEFVEILNRSPNPVDLANWKFTDGGSTGFLPSKIILPGDYVILTAPANSSLFQTLGTTLAITNFPTVNNAGETLKLIDNNDQPVDSVHYSDEWYGDDDKKQGGWTLELIDPENVCKGEENWTASIHESGGTPGTQNSVHSNIVDTEGPRVTGAQQLSGNAIVLSFDERLGSTLPEPENFTLQPSVEVAERSFTDATLRSIQLILADEIETGRTYRVEIANIYDCPGNLIDETFNTTFLNYDTLAPVIDSIRVISQNSVTIYLNEKIERAAAENVLNYSLQNENASMASLAQGDKAIELTFSTDFINGIEQSLNIGNIADINGNILDEVVSFLYFVPKPVDARDVIITEIFSDPSPVIGLPEFEFVEIFNRSANPINLRGWIFTDGSSTGVVQGDQILLQGAYGILTSPAGFNAFQTYGKTISIPNFPTINNSSDALVLKHPDGYNIDSVRFSSSWFRDDDKKEGGWTLELIDPEDICKGSDNWIASNDTIAGGTPGKQNSVYASVPDEKAPELVSVIVKDSVTVEVLFNERLAHALPAVENFQIEPDLSVGVVQFTDESKKSLLLSLTSEIEEGRTYLITLREISDCPGNKIAGSLQGFINLDTVPPAVTEIRVTSKSEIELLFSERLQKNSAEDLLNYSFEDGTFQVTTARLTNDLTSVLITLNQSLPNAAEQTLHVRNLTDINGNAIVPLSSVVFFFEAVPTSQKDIIITEIFADPSPSLGLPETEFLEIFNRSPHPVNLQNWAITDGGSVGKFPYVLLLPQQYLIVTSTSGYNNLSTIGRTAGVQNFPSLNNAEDYLVLRNTNGELMDSVSYSDEWYRDEDKSQGGFSLELIDPENICAEEENWTASEDGLGSTPGRQNSVYANKPDLTGPFLESVVPVSERELVLTFNEKLHSQLPGPSSFIIENFNVLDIQFTSQSLRVIKIALERNLERNTLYDMTVHGVYDCAGNQIADPHNKASFALPEAASPDDIVINEILFNPRPTGVDFIEVYNRSSKFISLRGWSLANTNADTIANQKMITDTDVLLMPSAYLVFTEDGNILKGEYLSGNEDKFFNTPSLPSMNDDDGSIALLDSAGNVIDALSYSKEMHSIFIKDDEGVSLERVSPTESSRNTDNWKSASAQAGFATPGYINSNSGPDATLDENAILIEPEIFQPEAGFQDFARINYHFDRGGFVANVKIIDPQGQEIREIAHNELLGTEGFFRWDGDQENGSRVRVGNYLVWFEVFDETGIVQTFRKRVAVAAKF